MNSEIEIVESFPYLGVKLTTNGNFGIAIKDLKDKGMRAFFKINSILRSQKVSQPDLSLKFFDTMVKAILTYGCQVWAQNLQQFDLNDISKVDKIPIEKFQNKQRKFILGINKYTSNIAARAELGRFPLYFIVILLTIKYLLQILKSPEKLPFKAYEEEFLLDSKGIKNWATFVRCVLTKCGLSHYWNMQAVPDENKFIRILKDKLQSQYKQAFVLTINRNTGLSKNTGNKLRTYAKIKIDYKMEKYMKYGLGPKLKKCIAQIRVSGHDLEIERGRKSRPKPTPAEERYCRHCLDKVEDEYHFIAVCPLYGELGQDPLSHKNILLELHLFWTCLDLTIMNSITN